MQAKEVGNVDRKRIFTHKLGDGFRSIEEWTKLLMGSCKELFLQVKPNFISHLKILWHPLLIMELLVLGIGHLQNILNLFGDVLDFFNEIGGFVGLGFSMGRFFLCGHKD
jgi:hypothetical protein